MPGLIEGLAYADGYLRANGDALQALCAIITTSALVPSAIVFALNQRAELKIRAHAKYNEAHESYGNFLLLCMAYPQVGAMYTSTPVAKDKLTVENLAIRDTIFDSYTAMIERAYLGFREKNSSFYKEQWRGWESYIDEYCKRPDYLEWWYRVMGEDSWEHAMTREYTTYDTRFEDYITGRIIRALRKAPFIDFLTLQEAEKGYQTRDAGK